MHLPLLGLTPTVPNEQTSTLLCVTSVATALSPWVPLTQGREGGGNRWAHNATRQGHIEQDYV